MEEGVVPDMTCPYIKGTFGHSTQGERHENVKAEQVMCLQAKDAQRWPANPQQLRDGRGTAPPSQPFQRTNPEDTLISDFQAPPLRDSAFLLVLAAQLVVRC